MPKLNYKEILDASFGRWLDIHAALAPSLYFALSRVGAHVPCPLHGGKDGFRLFDNSAETGGGICNTCGPMPNGIKVLEQVNGWSSHQAFEAIATYLGLGQEMPAKRLTKPTITQPLPVARQWAKKALNDVWNGTLPADAPESEVLRIYLANRRALVTPVPEVLRFHPGLRYSHRDNSQRHVDVGIYPAMIALVSDYVGKPVTLHRTFLSADGRKAEVSWNQGLLPTKKLMTPIHAGGTKGCAIRLFEPHPDRPLAVAEGIETALSVHIDTGFPVWSTISSGGMERLVIPPQVRELLVCIDNDDKGAGQLAAQRLIERAKADGLRVWKALAPRGSDWNDVVSRG